MRLHRRLDAIHPPIHVIAQRANRAEHDVDVDAGAGSGRAGWSGRRERRCFWRRRRRASGVDSTVLVVVEREGEEEGSPGYPQNGLGLGRGDADTDARARLEPDVFRGTPRVKSLATAVGIAFGESTVSACAPRPSSPRGPTPPISTPTRASAAAAAGDIDVREIPPAPTSPSPSPRRDDDCIAVSFAVSFVAADSAATSTTYRVTASAAGASPRDANDPTKRPARTPPPSPPERFASPSPSAATSAHPSSAPPPGAADAILARRSIPHTSPRPTHRGVPSFSSFSSFSSPSTVNTTNAGGARVLPTTTRALSGRDDGASAWRMSGTPKAFGSGARRAETNRRPECEPSPVNVSAWSVARATESALFASASSSTFDAETFAAAAAAAAARDSGRIRSDDGMVSVRRAREGVPPRPRPRRTPWRANIVSPPPRLPRFPFRFRSRANRRRRARRGAERRR